MATTLATGQITIIDMNDAIISGTAPTNPSVGTLWLKEIENGPDELYSWNGSEWILQQISLGGLDPGANQKIETAIDKLTNISKDSIITVSERLEVLNQVMLIVGKTLAETADMPTITDIDVNIRKGELFSVRREAANAGVATSHTAYVAVETTYNNLRTYLNPMSPKPWNVTLDSNITVVPDTWRTKWLDYYNAVASLREIVAAKQKENTDNAHTKIDDMANDNKLTPNEKQDAKKEWDIIQSEKTMIEQQATTFGITTEKESYLLTFNNLSTYITPLLSNLTVTTTIDGPTFRAKFKDYYDKKTAVLKKISDLTFNKFDDLANDNKLTPSEKKTVQREWEIIQTEKPILETQGSALAITTELNTYLTSFNSLKDYLLPLLTVLTVESTINGVEFRTKFTNYFTAKTALLKKINDIAHDQLDDIASDDKVTPNEKYALKKEWDTIKDEKPGLDVQATGLKITTELTTYRNSYTALEEYVTPLFNVMTSTSDVDGQLLRTKFTDYYAARNNLVRVINDLKVDIDDFNGNNIVTLLNDPATTFKIRMKQLDIEGGITISELSQEAKDMITNGSQDLINSNPAFFDWTGAYPNGYTSAAGAAPTKVTSDNGSGFVARYVSPASNQYMSQTVANKPFYQYVYVEITFKLESGTLDAAGVLFRYLKADGTSILYDQGIKLKDLVPSVQLNKWYTVSKVVKVNVSSDFSKYQIFVMPNFATFATVTAKTIQFSSVKTRSATEQEVKAFEANATLTSKASTWDAKETTAGAQSKADAAKNAAISTASSDATSKANSAQAAAIEAAQADAKNKADAAQAAAIAEAQAKAALAETNAKAHADGIVTAEEQARIKEAQDNLAAAKADAATKASAAEAAAKAAAAADATSKANQAKTDAISSAASDATSKANQAKTDAISTAATDATNKANKAEANAKNLIAGSIIKNPLFIDWTSTTPANTALWSTTPSSILKKETSLTRSSTSAVRLSPVGTEDAGLQLNGSFFITNVSNSKYLVVEIDFLLVSGSLSGAGLLVDWAGMAANNRVSLQLSSEVPSPVLNKWYTVRKLIVRPHDNVTGWTGMSGYLMANYDALGGKAAKSIIYDRLHIREATAEEIKAYDSDVMITNMSSDNKVTPVEKVQLKKEWAAISAEKPQYESVATTYGITTEKTNYVNAYNTLNTTVTSVLSNMQTTSDINGATFRATFDDYYDKKAQLTRKINELSRTLANNAQSTATNALNGVNDMTSDMKITPLEKSALKTTWDQIKAEYGQVFAQASSLNVSSADFVNAYNALNGTTPKIEADILSSMNTTYTFSSTTVRDTFRTQIATYFNEAEKVRKAINDSINNLAGAANTAAGNAQTSANTANQAITDMSSDSKITPVEKVQLKKEWAVIAAEKPQFESVATTYAITTEKTNYVNAYNALNTSITSILSNMSTTTDVNGATFRNTFDDYYDKKAQLVKKINELARSIGNNAQSTANTVNDKVTLSLDANNLNPNPSFEGKKNTFYTAATAFAATDAGVPAGAPKNFVGRQTGRDNYISDFFSVKAGDKFLVEGWIASTDSAQTFGLGLNTQTNDGTNNWLVSNHKPKDTGAWQYFSNIYTVTANHTKARFFSQINASASYGNWFFTDVRITKILNDDIIASSGNWNGTKSMVDDMSKDSKVTPLEKVQLKKEWAAISAEKPQYESLATTYEVGTEKTNYINSFNALNTLITSILANMSVTSDVDGATFRSTFDDYYDKKAQLVKVINELSREIATGARQMADTVNGILTTGKSDWDDAKKKIDLWKYSSDQLKINGGVIALKTIFAQQIALADFTNLCQINETANPLSYTIVTIANDKHFRIGTGAYATIQFADAPQVEFKVNDEYYYGFIGYKEAAVSNVNFIIRYHYTDGTWNNAGSSVVPIQTSGGFVEGTVKVTTAPTSGKTIKRVQYFMEKDSGTSGYYYLRNLELRKRNGGELIVDGAIRGKHVYADELEGKHLKSDTLESRHLKADIIESKHVKAESLEFDKMKGGTLRLGGVDNGNGKLEVYNPDGELIADLDATKGGFSELYVGNLISPNVVTYGNRGDSFSYYVSDRLLNYSGAIEPNDDNDGSGWRTPLATIEEAMRRIPKYLDSDVTIYLPSDGTFYQDLVIRGFVGTGSITINAFASTTINANVTFAKNLIDIKVTGALTINGRANSYAVMNLIENSNVRLEKVKVYGNGSSLNFDTTKGYTELINCETYGASYGISSRYGATVWLTDCIGSATEYGLFSYGGSFIGSSKTPKGGKGPRFANGVGFKAGAFSDNITDNVTDPTPSTPPPAPEKTTVFTATSGNSWRDNYGGQWYNQGIVAQGYWGGYGKYRGLWFFGDTLSTTLKGKTIKNMRLYVERTNSGGNVGAVTCTFRPHNYTTQPSGIPSFPHSASTQASFIRNEKKWITVPSSFWSLFTSGTAKGIGLWIDSTNQNYYARFTTVAKLEVTYV
ncbi:hypothetical protein AAXE64_27490 [Priestia megaterium]